MSSSTQSKIDLDTTQSIIYGIIKQHKCISALEINNRNPVLSLPLVESTLKFLEKNRLVKSTGSSPIRYCHPDFNKKVPPSVEEHFD